MAEYAGLESARPPVPPCDSTTLKTHLKGLKVADSSVNEPTTEETE